MSAWTRTDDETLVTGWRDGETMKRIGERIGRTRSAVSGRITTLGLVGRQGDPSLDLTFLDGHPRTAPKTEGGAKQGADPDVPIHPVADDPGELPGYRLEDIDGDAFVSLDLREGSSPSDRELAAMMEGLSRLVLPEAPDEIHAEAAAIACHLEHEGEDGGGRLVASRPLGDEIMVSLHEFAILEGTMMVFLETQAFLLGRPEAERYTRWEGTRDDLAIIGRRISRQNDTDMESRTEGK